MMKQEKKAEKTPILLTEAETDHVAGGDGVAHAYAFGRKDGHPAWSFNNGNAINAQGHN